MTKKTFYINLKDKKFKTVKALNTQYHFKSIIKSFFNEECLFTIKKFPDQQIFTKVIDTNSEIITSTEFFKKGESINIKPATALDLNIFILGHKNKNKIKIKIPAVYTNIVDANPAQTYLNFGKEKEKLKNIFTKGAELPKVKNAQKKDTPLIQNPAIALQPKIAGYEVYCNGFFGLLPKSFEQASSALKNMHNQWISERFKHVPNLIGPLRLRLKLLKIPRIPLKEDLKKKQLRALKEEFRNKKFKTQIKQLKPQVQKKEKEEAIFYFGNLPVLVPEDPDQILLKKRINKYPTIFPKNTTKAFHTVVKYIVKAGYSYNDAVKLTKKSDYGENNPNSVIIKQISTSKRQKFIQNIWNWPLNRIMASIREKKNPQIANYLKAFFKVIDNLKKPEHSITSTKRVDQNVITKKKWKQNYKKKN